MPQPKAPRTGSGRPKLMVALLVVILVLLLFVAAEIILLLTGWPDEEPTLTTATAPASVPTDVAVATGSASPSPSIAVGPSPSATSIQEQPSTPEPTDTPAATATEPATAERWFLLGRAGGELVGGHETGSVVISAADPSNMYIPIGENGLLISTTGGQSWTNVSEDLSKARIGYNVTQVIADPVDANTIYALVNGIVAVSTDLGRNWDLRLPDNPLAAIAMSSNGQTLYAVSQNGFHVSSDQGRTWSVDYPVDWSSGYALSAKVAVDAQDSDVAYIVVRSRLYVTNSGGRDWSTPNLLSAVSLRQVLADPILMGLAYVLTEENALYRTVDGGESWGLIADLNRYGENVGASFYSDPVLLGASNGLIYIRGTAREGGTGPENSCGFALIVSEDQGATWKQLGHFPVLRFRFANTLCTSRVYPLGIHPDDPTRIYCVVNQLREVTPRISFLVSSDSGNTWDLQEPLPEPSWISASADGRVIYVSGTHASRSADGGETWHNIAGELFGGPYDDGGRYDTFLGIAQSPQDPDTAYLAVGQYPWGPNILKTVDGGASWVKLNPPYNSRQGRIWINPWKPDHIYAQPNLLSTDAGSTWGRWPSLENMRLATVAVNPDNPDHILLGVIDGGLYFSSDGGQTVGMRGLGADFSVHSVAFDARNPQRVYAVVEASNQVSLYRSDDEGASWDIVSGLHGVGDTLDRVALLIDPRESDTLYLARRQLYRSVDGGVSWHLLTTGMTPNENITDIVMTSTDPAMLYAAGRSGMWRLTLP